MPKPFIPSVVQLPGGRTLNAVPFKITERFPDGSPKTFEILPRGSSPVGVDRCALYAQEDAIRYGDFAR